MQSPRSVLVYDLGVGFADEVNSDLEDDEENKIHGKRGRILGSVSFQPYQMVNLMQALWKSADRSLLEFLYPMSIKNSWEMFFIRYLLVSANKFRPIMKSTSFGGGSGDGTLHNRTNALLQILGVAEKIQFALGVLTNVSCGMDFGSTCIIVRQHCISYFCLLVLA